METVCPKCNGAGEIISNPCTTCDGTGTEVKDKKVSLTFPPGVDTGMKMVHRGGGSIGSNGRQGDLTIEIYVEKDPYFTREHTDLYSNISISLKQALLGDKVGVRTLDGEVDLKVTPGINNGEIRRLRGKGTPNPQGGPNGDHFVTFNVKMPTNLTERQKELINEFEEEETKKSEEK